MKFGKRICACALGILAGIFPLLSSADGVRQSFVQTDAVIPADTVAVEDMLAECTASSIIVTETSTGRVLFEKDSSEQRECSHFAKLMVLLLAAEKIDSGDISLSDTATVSAYANSRQGTQIWLDKGEKITVEELVKSITVGNANDGCAALAEYVCGSEEDAVKLMNQRAESLGMTSTVYTDSTGTEEGNLTSAADTEILCRELLKYRNMTEYLTCWLDNVRGGKAELVNLNRLVRTYKGVTGMKAWSGETAGSCTAVTAKRGDMSVCVVLLGCPTNEDRDAEAKKLLDLSFQTYEVYTPEIPEELKLKIKIAGGTKLKGRLEISKLEPVIIPRGTYRSVECVYTLEDTLSAPVKKGDKAGEIVYTMGDETIAKGEIVSAENIDKMDLHCGFEKLMYNLLNM